MKAFRFRLDRVLDWRRTEQNLEESRLKQLYGSIAQLENERTALESASDRAARSLLSQPAIDGLDLQALNAYRAAVRAQSARLKQKRRERESELNAQKQKLLEARRRLRLLENLRDRRRVEWSYGVEREEAAEQNGPFRALQRLVPIRRMQG